MVVIFSRRNFIRIFPDFHAKETDPLLSLEPLEEMMVADKMAKLESTSWSTRTDGESSWKKIIAIKQTGNV